MHAVASEKYNLNVQSGEYAKVAEALGGYGEKVTEPDEIVPAVERARASVESGKAALLEIITAEEPAFSLYQ